MPHVPAAQLRSLLGTVGHKEMGMRNLLPGDPQIARAIPGEAPQVNAQDTKTRRNPALSAHAIQRAGFLRPFLAPNEPKSSQKPSHISTETCCTSKIFYKCPGTSLKTSTVQKQLSSQDQAGNKMSTASTVKFKNF